MAQTQTPATTAPNGKGKAHDLPEGWEEWPAAAEAARRAKVSRQHIYRLIESGELEAVEGTQSGRKVLRINPDSIERFLVEGGEPQEAAEMASSGEFAVAVRLVSEARQIASEARKGQHDAYQLIAQPSRELIKLLLEANAQKDARIRELEGQLNAMHDAQRDARKEDREWLIAERAQAAEDSRKEQVIDALKTHWPTIVEQLSETLKAKRGMSSGPLMQLLQQLDSEQQKKLAFALQAIIKEDGEEQHSNDH